MTVTHSPTPLISTPLHASTLFTKEMNFLAKANHLQPREEAPLEDYLKTGELREMAHKSLTSEAEHGGILLPEADQRLVTDLQKELCPMRQVSTSITISGPSLDLLISPLGTDVGWVKESQERDETDAPLLSKISIKTHELYAKPRATQRLLDDAKIDVEVWLRTQIAKSMSRAENKAFTKGDGTEQPRGFLTVPRRTPGSSTSSALESFKTGEVGGLGDKPIDTLLKLYYALPEWYMEKACWMMSRSMLPLIKSLKMGDNYVWSPANSLGMRDLLLGHEIVLNDDMPSPQSPSTDGYAASLAFGNFKASYTIVDRAGIETLRDPYSSKPYVEFYTTKRVGGDLIDYDALKLLLIGA